MAGRTARWIAGMYGTPMAAAFFSDGWDTRVEWRGSGEEPLTVGGWGDSGGGGEVGDLGMLAKGGCVDVTGGGIGATQ